MVAFFNTIICDRFTRRAQPQTETQEYLSIHYFLFGAFVLKHYVSNLWSELEILYNSKRVVCIYRVNKMYNWNVRDIEILLKSFLLKA